MARVARKQQVENVIEQEEVEEVEEVEEGYSEIEEGSLVTFLGFSEEGGENADLLEEGEVYEIAGIREETEENEMSYFIQVDNPDFNPDKRKSKSNPQFIEVDVFPEEVELVANGPSDEELEEEEEPEPAPRKATKKAAAKKAAPKKATAKKTSTKKAAAKKAIAKAAKAAEEATGEQVDPDLADMIILSEDQEDEEVLELVNESDDLVGLAQELMEEGSSLEYKIGGILYHIRLSKAYKTLDESYQEKGGFGLFLDEVLGIGYRKAMDLIKIYTTFNFFGISQDVVRELGWTKSIEVARVVNEDNKDDLVDVAKNNTVNDLKETIKESFAREGGGKEVVKKIIFKFKLVENEGDRVREMFEAAKAYLEMKKDEDVFAAIVMDWAEEHLEVTKTVAATKARAGSKKVGGRAARK